MYNKRNKDELFIQCTVCKCERLHAYWDFELECYIYLTDEPPICEECLSAQNEQLAYHVKEKRGVHLEPNC